MIKSDPVVLIDDREGSKLLINYPPLDKYGVLTHIGDGNETEVDVVISGNGPNGILDICVEVKSISDLIGSIQCGRLQATQVPNMLEKYQLRYILYYGAHRCNDKDELEAWYGKCYECGKTYHGCEVLCNRCKKKTVKGGWSTFRSGNRSSVSKPIPYGYLKAMMIEIGAHGFHCESVLSINDAAKWIGVLVRYWSKSWDEHKGMLTFDRSAELTEDRFRSIIANLSDEEPEHLSLGTLPLSVNTPEYRVAYTASTLPGVRAKRAIAVSRVFKTIRQMCRAGEKEWLKVEGIGKGLWKSINEYLGD